MFPFSPRISMISAFGVGVGAGVGLGAGAGAAVGLGAGAGTGVGETAGVGDGGVVGEYAPPHPLSAARLPAISPAASERLWLEWMRRVV